MYSRPVRKKRTAFFDDPVWVEVFERGKVPREDLVGVEGGSHPAPDVYDLVLQRELSDLRWRVEQLCMALSKPSVVSGVQGSSSSSLNPGQLLRDFAEIWDFLAKPTYQDGTPRLTGKVSLACASAGLQVTLTDPTSNSYCCLTFPTLDDAFLALEVGLKEGSLPWRLSGYANGRKK